MQYKNLIIVIVGPTASGKSELAVKIAKKIDGEIISADSRQIYKALDIGSGKVEGLWKIAPVKSGRIGSVYMYKGIPHYLIDEASPRVQYSVTRFQKKAREEINDILQRGKVPIICGGTGHWIDAVIFDQTFPNIKADGALRSKLTKLSTEQLFSKLQKLDSVRAASIDSKNPRRLVRALEIVISSGKPVPEHSSELNTNFSAYANVKIKWFGLNPNMAILETKIAKRLQSWLKSGLVQEVKKLRDPKTGIGLSWKRIESFGLEYKFCAQYLQGKISKEEMENLSYTSIRQYAKRQMTWWKRNENIKWCKDYEKVLKKFS